MKQTSVYTYIAAYVYVHIHTHLFAYRPYRCNYFFLGIRRWGFWMRGFGAKGAPAGR